ncbi:MAG: hypothetical protein R2932_26125 [Caldilineaceae bacterium]
MKRFLGLLFNLNTYMRELYEENFCYLIPCYELRYELDSHRQPGKRELSTL